ncbi:MAG: T9SS type A sorting domain-containing protein [Flavobacteriales bacterium]|nr:T9SS type A sorting domain-containing protein [Flavobacteriales bacterium]
MKKLYIFTFIILFPLVYKAQDTITVMAYNILNYPLSNSTKADTLKPIVLDIKPDIFLITELTSGTGATTILNDALNVNGITYYQKANYMDGPDTDNMLFFNSNKLKLKSQYEIPTVLRNISEYVLYYDDGNLTPGTDTTFIHCYMAHLKASNTPSDSIQRNQEATSFKNYLDNKAQPIENIIMGGDFNLYTSTEAAYNTLLNGGSVALNDPINTPGEWHNDFNYRFVHTQSTRTFIESDGGASGGLDDRFDFLLTGTDIINGTNHLEYITGTYKAYGNDGNHYNKAINGTPTNTAVPANIANALYYMSDHLPVVMKMYYEGPTGIEDLTDNNLWKGFYSNDYFKFVSTENENKLTVEVLDLVGKTVKKESVFNQKSFNLNLSEYTNGLYFVKVNNQKFQKTFRIVKY